MTPEKKSRWLRLALALGDASAGPLALLTPFLVFVKHNDYALNRPEIWVCIAAIASLGFLIGLAMALGGSYLRVPLAAALITLVADFQSTWFMSWGLPIVFMFLSSLLLAWLLRRHLCRLLGIVFAVMLATTLLLPSGTQWKRREVAPGADRPGLPPIVHIVTDEQIAVEGIPREFDSGGRAASRLKRFYAERGFTLFGRAYSRYYDTYASLSHLVNLTAGAESFGHFDGEFRKGMSVVRNAYFEELTARGYGIHVYQTNYMDFCNSEGEIDIATCFTYDLGTIKSIETAPLAVREKVRMISGMFTRMSFVLVEFRTGYSQMQKSVLGRRLGLPVWSDHVGYTSSVSAMSIIDLLTHELAGAREGSMYFVHLMLPHQPFAYDRECSLRPRAAQWLTGWAWAARPRRNNDATRAIRYPRYLEQMECTYRQLARIFDAMRAGGAFDDALIVVHGDHGSRLDRGPPLAANRANVNDADLVDAFSTLFAVKIPGETGAYVRDRLALEQLLEQVLRPGRAPAGTGGAEAPYVYLDAGSASMARHPFPGFFDGIVSAKLEELRELARREPSFGNYLNLGMAFYRNRLYVEALRFGHRALEINPESPVVHNHLCETHIALRAPEDALEACRRALELNPEYQRAAANLERAEAAKRAADRELRKLHGRAKEEPSYANYFALAFAHQQRKSLRESIGFYEKAIELEPNAVAYSNMCAAYNDLGMWDEAESACREAVRLDPDLERARNNLRISQRGRRRSAAE